MTSIACGTPLRRLGKCRGQREGGPSGLARDGDAQAQLAGEKARCSLRCRLQARSAVRLPSSTRSAKTNLMDSAHPTTDATSSVGSLSGLRSQLGQPGFTSRNSFASFASFSSKSAAFLWNKAADG